MEPLFAQTGLDGQIGGFIAFGGLPAKLIERRMHQMIVVQDALGLFIVVGDVFVKRSGDLPQFVERGRIPIGNVRSASARIEATVGGCGAVVLVAPGNWRRRESNCGLSSTALL